MNIKYTVKNDGGHILTCVLNPEEDLTQQFEKVLHIRRGNGIGVLIRADGIEVTDYYHGSAMASFAVLSREETEEAVSLRWTSLEECN